MLSCSSASKEEDYTNTSKITILGHAGSGFLSIKNFQPPNSYAAIKKALKNGAAGVEVDVQLSKDSIPILFHDLELSKLTNLKGCISDFNADELINTPYNCGFFYDIFQSEKLISLEKLLQEFLLITPIPEVHLDLKDYNPCLKENRIAEKFFAQQIADVIDNTTFPLSKLAFISMNVEILKELRSINSNFNLYLEETADFNIGFTNVMNNDFKGITIKPELLSIENTTTAHKNNKIVITFGGSSAKAIQKLIDAKPDYIQVNNVAKAMQLIKE